MANEKRLIDADALIDSLYDNEFAMLCPLDEVSGVVDSQPTIAAVEVVRCGECTHWDEDKLYCHHPAGLSYCGQAGAGKGFCCFGERREQTDA